MNAGPNIEKEGLLFGYDTNYGVADCGLSTRFYKGRSTTNISATHHASGHSSGNYGNDVTVVDAPEKGDGWKKVTIKDRGNNFRILQWQYTSHTSNVVYSHSAEFDWGNMIEKGYSITFDGSGGGSRNYFRNGNYTSNEGSSINKSLEDGHFASNIVKSGSHVHAWFIYHYSTGVSGLNDFFYYRDYQVEVNSVSSPYTSSNRSNTDSLIDLTKSTDIDVSNVSFDLTGQPMFDGTDDYLQPFDLNLEGMGGSTLEAVIYMNNLSGSDNSYNIFGGVATGNRHGYHEIRNSGSGWKMTYWTSSNGWRYANTSLLSNTWYHVVWVWDGLNLTWFLNGDQDGTYTFSTFSPYSLGIKNIGNFPNERYMNGNISVAKIYNRALTPEEIKQNFNTYKNRFDI